MTAHILFLASDLFFAPNVEVAAKGLGFELKQDSEYRSVAEFIAKLAAAPPALVILDLNSALPWVEWLPAAKADAKLASIPWLAFGSHMNPRRLAAARHSGADRVVPKSQFSAELSELIQSLLRK